MTELIFILSLAALFFTVYSAAFRVLPDEKWQIAASIPLYRNDDNSWHGVNITYYGILTATGYTFAFTVFIVMMSSAGVSAFFLLLLLAFLLLLFIPSAKIMAFIIERKKHTITVGGAVFVMFISAPWVISFLNGISPSAGFHEAAEIVFFSSLINAYAFGEGFGRLACISFGCCYGKAVDELPAFLRKVFSTFYFTYTGKTKKISYHDHMDGIKTVPVQAITAVLYTSSGLAGLYLFLSGRYYSSFFVSLAITQLWRFASEFLRADYRGEGRISVYQIMSLSLIPYYVIYIHINKTAYYAAPQLISGLMFIWNPGMIIIIFFMWTGCILYTGISRVTSSAITIYVNEDKI